MGIVLNDRGPKKPMGGLWDIAYASLFFVWDDAKRNWPDPPLGWMGALDG